MENANPIMLFVFQLKYFLIKRERKLSNIPKRFVHWTINIYQTEETGGSRFLITNEKKNYIGRLRSSRAAQWTAINIKKN